MSQIDNQIDVLTDQLNAIQRQMDDLADHMRPFTDRMNELEELYMKVHSQIETLTEEKMLIQEGLIRIVCPACRGHGRFDMSLKPMMGSPGLEFDLSDLQCPSCKGKKYLIAKKFGG